MEINDIQLYLDGVTRSFGEWTEDFVDTYYPDLDQRSYRVPALHFNQQRLDDENEKFEGLELLDPEASHARGDLAHTLVLDSLEKLDHQLMQRQRGPLFIISALNYDNYLYRVKAPPRRKGKENRPKAKAKVKDTVQKSDGSILQGNKLGGESQENRFGDMRIIQGNNLDDEGNIRESEPDRDRDVQECEVDGLPFTAARFLQKELRAGGILNTPQEHDVEFTRYVSKCGPETPDDPSNEGVEITSKENTALCQSEEMGNPSASKPKAKRNKKKKKKASPTDSTAKTSPIFGHTTSSREPSTETANPPSPERPDLNSIVRKSSQVTKTTEPNSSALENMQARESKTGPKCPLFENTQVQKNKQTTQTGPRNPVLETIQGKGSNPVTTPAGPKSPFFENKQVRENKQTTQTGPRSPFLETIQGKGSNPGTTPTGPKSPVLENMDVRENTQTTGPKSPVLETIQGKGSNPVTTPTGPKSTRGKDQQLPPRLTDHKLRGEIDVVLLQAQCGVTLMEVKATGHPGWKHPTDQQIRDSVVKAADQVKRGRDVFHFIMPDLSCPPSVTLVVALPYITTQRLHQALSGVPSDPELVFLCKDHMDGFDRLNADVGQQGEADLSEPRDPQSTYGSAASAPQSVILNWWNRNIATKGSPLSLANRKTIVGRTCGLLSVVSVWTMAGKPRVEVRTAKQAISEVADRFSDIVLLPSQASLLAYPSLTRLCLTGPMGSGKTLLLQLKGRQWVREGRRVVVLNVRSTGIGRPIGHVLEEAIGKQTAEGEAGGGSVERHDLATKGFDMAAFHAELEKRGPTDRLCFVLDELTHHTFSTLEELVKQYPDCCMWCVAMFVRRLPPGFQHHRLGAVLRSPPSVQLLLKDLDRNRVHEDAYSTRSATRGLPCDGPPIMFINHEEHDTLGKPHDCPQCADQLVDFLLDNLGLVCPDLQQPEPSAAQPGSPSKPGRPRAKPKTVEAQPLSFRDVLLLVGAPLGYYKQQEDELWLMSQEDMVTFCKYIGSCAFFSRLKDRGLPLKFIYDNTSKDIAMSSTDEIVVTDVMGVQSLERKVVIFLPGGAVLKNDRNNAVGCTDNTVPPSCTEISASSAPDQISAEGQLVDSTTCVRPTSACESQQTDESRQGSTKGLLTKKTMIDQAHSACIEDVERGREETKPVCSASADSPLRPSEGVTVDTVPPARETTGSQPDIKHLLGNMMVGGTLPALTAAIKPGKRGEDGAAKPRMGMDLRGDSPWLLSALKDWRSENSSTQHSQYRAEESRSVRDPDYPSDRRSENSSTQHSQYRAEETRSVRDPDYPSDRRSENSSTQHSQYRAEETRSVRDPDYPSDRRSENSSTQHSQYRAEETRSVRDPDYPSDRRSENSSTQHSRYRAEETRSVWDPDYPSDQQVSTDMPTMFSQLKLRETSPHVKGCVAPMDEFVSKDSTLAIAKRSTSPLAQDPVSPSVHQIASDKSRMLSQQSSDETSSTQGLDYLSELSISKDSPTAPSDPVDTENPSSKVEDLFKVDSMFTVRDEGLEEGRTRSELCRIRKAVSQLSMDDQDWLFMAAARCLSQLVVVVPCNQCEEGEEHSHGSCETTAVKGD